MTHVRRAALVLVLLPACAKQDMARAVFTHADLGTGPTAEGPPATSAPQASALGAQLQAAGLDLNALPALDEVDGAHIIDVMKAFTAALGVKCGDCHEMDKKVITPEMRVAKRMWSDFVQQMTLANGQPLFCDSCHQGKKTFLDRTDPDALGKWMGASYVAGLARRDGTKQTCSSCHGKPFDPKFLDAWRNEGATDGGTADAAAYVDLGTRGNVDLSIPGACTLVVNEVQVAGSAGASDEFVELWNPCASAAALDGHTLVYRSAAGTADTTLVKLDGHTLAAGAYLVVGNTAYSGTADVRYASSLAGTGGGVALRDATGAVVDSIAYGTATNAFVEGTPAPAPPSGKSAARTPNGSHANNDQSRDLVVATPTPGAAN